MESEILDQFQYGFEAGVAYANAVKGTDGSVTVEYVGNFYDADAGERIATRMYEDGCDVIYAAAVGAGLVRSDYGRRDHAAGEQSGLRELFEGTVNS